MRDARGSGRRGADMGLRGPVSRSERFEGVRGTHGRRRRSRGVLGELWAFARSLAVRLCMLGAICALVVRFDLVQEGLAGVELVNAKIEQGPFAFWRWE